MKKTLTALAVLSAFMSNASAQSNVTIYGIVDAGLTHVTNDGPVGDRTTVEAGQLQVSRWGFRGVEDIGNGYKARFDLEGTLLNDTGTAGVLTGSASGQTATSLFDRQSTVGLVTPYGTIDIGRQNILGVGSVGLADPMGLAFAATSPNVLFAAMNHGGVYGAYGANYAGTALRQNNSVKVVTMFGGIGFALMHAAGEQANNSSNSTYNGVSAFYTGGPLGVAGAYAEMKHSSNGDKLKSYALGAKYDVMGATVKGTFSANETEITNRTISVLGVGVDVPVAPAITLTGAFYNTKRYGDGITDDSQQYIAIAKYAFSKRSIGYVSIGHAATDSVVGATQAINLAQGFVAPGSDSANRFTVGIQHAF